MLSCVAPFSSSNCSEYSKALRIEIFFPFHPFSPLNKFHEFFCLISNKYSSLLIHEKNLFHAENEKPSLWAWMALFLKRVMNAWVVLFCSLSLDLSLAGAWWFYYHFEQNYYRNKWFHPWDSILIVWTWRNDFSSIVWYWKSFVFCWWMRINLNSILN